MMRDKLLTTISGSLVRMAHNLDSGRGALTRECTKLSATARRGYCNASLLTLISILQVRWGKSPPLVRRLSLTRYIIDAIEALTSGSPGRPLQSLKVLLTFSRATPPSPPRSLWLILWRIRTRPRRRRHAPRYSASFEERARQARFYRSEICRRPQRGRFPRKA